MKNGVPHGSVIGTRLFPPLFLCDKHDGTQADLLMDQM